MLLLNVIKVIDPEHELNGEVLILDHVDRETFELVCYKWTGKLFGKEQPRVRFTMDQARYGCACVITHRPPEGGTEHYLNREKDPNGKDRLYDEHGVPRNEEFPDADFKPITRGLVRD